jgi:hemerythrin
MSKFFSDETKGVNADLHRHRKKHQEFIQRISELESIENKTEMDEAMLLCYRGLLSSLEESKADVVSKIGKKKH